MKKLAKLILILDTEREVILEYQGKKSDLVALVAKALEDHQGYRDIIGDATHKLLDDHLVRHTGKNLKEHFKDFEMEQQLERAKGDKERTRN